MPNQNDHISNGERYAVAAHAMQSGVAFEMAMDEREGVDCAGGTSPKHLRVGVNSAMCNHAALVKLLISKGLLTNSEYLKAIADEMELEKARYEKALSDRTGKRITLG